MGGFGKADGTPASCWERVVKEMHGAERILTTVGKVASDLANEFQLDRCEGKFRRRMARSAARTGPAGKDGNAQGWVTGRRSCFLSDCLLAAWCAPVGMQSNKRPCPLAFPTLMCLSCRNDLALSLDGRILAMVRLFHAGPTATYSGTYEGSEGPAHRSVGWDTRRGPYPFLVSPGMAGFIGFFRRRPNLKKWGSVRRTNPRILCDATQRPAGGNMEPDRSDRLFTPDGFGGLFSRCPSSGGSSCLKMTRPGHDFALKPATAGRCSLPDGKTFCFITGSELQRAVRKRKRNLPGFTRFTRKGASLVSTERKRGICRAGFLLYLRDKNTGGRNRSTGRRVRF